MLYWGGYTYLVPVQGGTASGLQNTPPWEIQVSVAFLNPGDLKRILLAGMQVSETFINEFSFERSQIKNDLIP